MPGRCNKYPVELTEEQRETLKHLLRAGSSPTQKLTHARILLKAEQAWSNEQIAKSLETSIWTVWRTRKSFVQSGLQAALEHKPLPRRLPRRVDGRAEAHLIALACGPPPEGRARWTLRLLADKFVELEGMPAISYETVRRVLKKKRARPASQAAMVHSASARCGVCLRDGGRAGYLRAPLQ